MTAPLLEGVWHEHARPVRLSTESGRFVSAVHLPARQDNGNAASVLVHGYRGIPAEWAPFAGRLAEDRDVWVLELPGHHVTSDADTDAWDGTTADHLEAIDAVRNAAGQDPIELIGQSYGGYLAVLWSSLHGVALVRTVLIAPSITPLSWWWQIPGAGRVLTLPAAHTSERDGYLARLAGGRDAFFAGDCPDPSLIPEQVREVLFQARAAATADPGSPRREEQLDATCRGFLPHLCSMRKSRQLMEQIHTPLLWLHGRLDPRVPFGPSRRCATRSGHTFIELAGIGHMPHLECTERTLDLIASWRTTVPA